RPGDIVVLDDVDPVAHGGVCGVCPVAGADGEGVVGRAARRRYQHDVRRVVETPVVRFRGRAGVRRGPLQVRDATAGDAPGEVAGLGGDIEAPQLAAGVGCVEAVGDAVAIDIKQSDVAGNAVVHVGEGKVRQGVACAAHASRPPQDLARQSVENEHGVADRIRCAGAVAVLAGIV